MKKNSIKRIIKKIIHSPIIVLFYIFRIFKIEDRKIVCINFNGKGYGDNPKYIADELLKQNKDIKIFWVIKNRENTDIPKEIIPIYKKNIIKYVYHMATAKIWINNVRMNEYVVKRKKQYYIQTWHAGLGLKKVEQAAEEFLPKKYVKLAKRDSKMIDLAISNSNYRTEMYKNGFWYNGEILECGSPRNDLFFDKAKIYEINSKIRQRYNIDSDKKIVLYAPTFRKDTNYNYYDMDFEKIIDNLNCIYKEKFVFLIKLHPIFANNTKTPNRFVNVTDYPDADELLTITDILISDYSSLIFDFLFTNKPVYLYAPDYEEYVNGRGLNFTYNELPFSIAYTKEELINNLKNKEHEQYNEKLNQFLKLVNIKDDGAASNRVVQKIINVIEGSEKNEKI